MIVRAGSGWQTVLADLSLILFMVTAAALSQARDEPRPVLASPRAEPLARWRAGPDAPPLPEWLAAQSPDARQQLTIVAHYPPGELARSLDEAQQLARAAAAAGVPARIVVEPGGDGTSAALAFDLPDPGLARGLREAGPDQPSGKITP